MRVLIPSALRSYTQIYEAAAYGATLDEVLDGALGAQATERWPAVYGYSFGHIAHQVTLPLGVRARLDAGAQTLTLLEPAVG